MSHTLGIIEYRNIVNALKEHYELDFSNYAFTAFVRRLEDILEKQNLSSADELIAKIKSDQNFYEIFVGSIAIPETEMFRDPGLWRELRDNIFTDAISQQYKIWLPDVTTGEELYTLAIVLKESQVPDKVKVIATCFGEQSLKKVRTGLFGTKQMDINLANYKRYNEAGNLSDYYTVRNGEAQMDTDLMKNIELRNENIFQISPPTKIRMVMYRNKMIYYNKRLQCQAVDKIFESLLPGGNLIIGARETLDACNIDKRFILVNEGERIYRKSYS